MHGVHGRVRYSPIPSPSSSPPASPSPTQIPTTNPNLLSEPLGLSSCCGLVMRVILHFDLDCFYAAVEGRRLGIDGFSQPLAVVQWDGLIAVSYAARDYGIKRGMRQAEAVKLCPNLQLVHVEYLRRKGMRCQRRLGAASVIFEQRIVALHVVVGLGWLLTKCSGCWRSEKGFCVEASARWTHTQTQSSAIAKRYAASVWGGALNAVRAQCNDLGVWPY